MTCSFTPFGDGSRVVSLWDMLRFYANTFVEVLNTLSQLEGVLGLAVLNKTVEIPDSVLVYVGSQVKNLHEQLQKLGLPVSAEKANELDFGLTTPVLGVSPSTRYKMVKQNSEELRRRIADELKGKVFFYISDHVGLLSDSMPFGEQVDEAFPSARYDISEAGRCLALRRSTACVLHLMRALEVALASLAAALGQSMTASTWNKILRVLETEIRSRDKKALGEKWSAEDEQFFAEAATHFTLIKNAWRNNAMHGRDKYTEEQAEEIYDCVRSFMNHLSGRLSEAGQAA